MILDRFRLDDRVAVVTGAGRGLGAAMAVGFAEAGADVVISSRTQEQLEEVAGAVEAAGRRAHVVAADLSDTQAVAALADTAVAEFGRLDVVVNNVGGTMPMPALQTTDEMFEEAFHFNVTTALALSRAAIPHLLDQPGASILNISSAMGRLTGRGFLAYGTAKAALAHMTRLLARDVAPRIRVNGIAVGSVQTSALDVVAGNDELRGQLEQATPLRRLGDPREVATTALYLCSEAASYVTGKVLEVDGGIEAPNLEIPLPDLEPGDDA